MKRMISATRLAALLRESKFALTRDRRDSTMEYARPSPFADLWEKVSFCVRGKRGEAVGAYVEVSVCYAFNARGLTESRYIQETEELNLKSKAEAQKWEEAVVSTLPGHVEGYTAEAGPALLKRTVDARAAVAQYLQLFGTLDWKALRQRLELRATTREISEAERIAKIPPTIQLYNGLYLFRTVILGIMLYSEEVEGRQIAPFGVDPWPGPWPGADPWPKNPSDWSKWQLAWRIEMLADRLLGRYPEMMPNSLPEEL
jgi:hypothetical protein